MSSFQIVYPFTMPIMGDNVKDAIKKFAKFNRDMNINRMIIRDQNQHWDARLNYYTQDIRNKVGINMFPIQADSLPISSDVFIPQQVAEFNVPKYEIQRADDDAKMLAPFRPFGPYGPSALAEVSVPKYSVVRSEEDAKMYTPLSPIMQMNTLSPLTPVLGTGLGAGLGSSLTPLRIPHLS